MMSNVSRTVWLAFALAACGGSNMDSTPGADASIDGAGSGSGWTTLISKGWTLQPHSENTSDLQIETLDHDTYIGGLRPIAPLGTHHTLLFRGLTGTNAIYASGVGTGELIFPAGKGLKIAAGTSLGLQLHIYNTGDEVLNGTSGVEMLEIPASEITEEVDMFLPGPKNLSIAPGPQTQTGTCTIAATQQIFALFPHMHQWGTHFKTTLTVAGTDQVLHDADYTFEHQDVESFTPITLNAGDKITTTCSWNNTTAGTITYGESSDTEMCYSIMYRYPKQNNEFCTN
jgi:hypothetical protein